MTQTQMDLYYINLALAVSKGSRCRRRQYGAVLVSQGVWEMGVVTATGFNQVPQSCIDCGYCNRERVGATHKTGYAGTCTAQHAEWNIVTNASREEMLGATLYMIGTRNGELIIGEPCEICEILLKNSGIEWLVTYDPETSEIERWSMRTDKIEREKVSVEFRF